MHNARQIYHSGNNHEKGVWRDVAPQDQDKSGCANKVTYLSRTAARKARHICEQKYRKRYAVYHCENCNGFHLTTHGRLEK